MHTRALIINKHALANLSSGWMPCAELQKRALRRLLSLTLTHTFTRFLEDYNIMLYENSQTFTEDLANDTVLKRFVRMRQRRRLLDMQIHVGLIN